jgi:hypothetical protein|tara:strand:- start:2543 stop:2758 length:216 start_codon:yes stop_codon:yes gene_type:complete
MTTGYKLIRVRRDRCEAWRPGYFDPLISQRIPYANPATGDPMTGVLMNVEETETWFSLVFHEVERETTDTV